MEDILKNPTSAVIAAWALKEVWVFLKEKFTGHASAIKDLTKEISETKFAMIETRVKMETHAEALRKLPKLEQDLNALHAWRRASMSKDLNGHDER